MDRPRRWPMNGDASKRRKRRVALAATAWAALRAMRPTQWSKNGLVLLAAIFSRTMLDSPTATRVLIGFAAFCLAASGVYIVNDLADRQRDQLHPRKRNRPIASGALGVGLAVGLAAALFAGRAGAGALADAGRPVPRPAARARPIRRARWWRAALPAGAAGLRRAQSRLHHLAQASGAVGCLRHRGGIRAAGAGGRVRGGGLHLAVVLSLRHLPLALPGAGQAARRAAACHR